MAHIQDRWETIVEDKRVRTNRYGQGKRWRARYLDPACNERSKTFARKQDAERFLTAVAADVLRGTYVDPDAGKVTFAEFADQWLEAARRGQTLRPPSPAVAAIARSGPQRTIALTAHDGPSDQMS